MWVRVAEVINNLRIVPRLCVFAYMWMMYDIVVWYTGLIEPTTQQTTFVSVLVGLASAIFGLYVNSGSVKNDKKE